MGIENTDIEVCSFKSASPEAIGSNVETCTILDVRRGTCENFPGNRLQVRFDADVTADFGKKIRCQVSDFIVSYGREATFRARKGMLNGELGTTGTSRWSM